MELMPLPTDVLTSSVTAVLEGAPTGKLMAARGISVLRPSEMVTAVYQLWFDPDPDVKAAAEAAPQTLPDKVLLGPLADLLPAPVLHFFAARLSLVRIEAIEKILYNPATADETYVLLATRLPERELEIIFQNDERLLRCPAIVQALYFNKAARMSSVNRAIELLARNHVRVEGIPCYDEIAREILDDATSTDPSIDAKFQAAVDIQEADLPVDAHNSQVAESQRPKKEESARKGPVIEFGKLKLFEKIRLATLGNAYCRNNLIRDSNRMVAMAVIRSPLITDGEIVKAAGSRQVCEDVIRYVANQREYLKLYQVKLNLVLNPKCPVGLSMRLVSTLMNDDIKSLARSKNVPSSLVALAKKLVMTRGLA